MGWLKSRTSEIGHRVSGLPVSLANWPRPRSGAPIDRLRHLYARRYWRVRKPGQAIDLLLAVLLAPVLVPGVALLHSMRSGPGHARVSGRPVLRQFVDQLRLYAASGVMPGSYYIFSLYERPTAAHARSFLKRSETKGLLYRLVRARMPPQQSFSDKGAFAEQCRLRGLPVVPTIAIARAGALDSAAPLPDENLFIKPLHGKGGKGAERWVALGGGRFQPARGPALDEAQLRAHLGQLSRSGPVIVQPCMVNHPALAELNCGALATVRVLTCLDAAGEPEIMGAAMRMAIDRATVVDNFHVGGIAAAVDPLSGVLGPATDLGKDAAIGWRETHPVSGGRIAGRLLEGWDGVRDLALAAHRAFADRLFVGWDIAVTAEGAVIVEANGSPDLDILQRTSRRGMADSRFAELLAERLELRSGG